MIKFAFYGRVSTEDQQDPESSRSWQLTRSSALIEARGGVIVTEFFDVDKQAAQVQTAHRRERRRARPRHQADVERARQVEVLAEYVRHDNGHRPHQALNQRPPQHQSDFAIDMTGRIERSRVAGGLISEYRIAA
jgi:hypothetical protein